MPKKSKQQKIKFKVNDKKVTDYMFDLTRTIIFVFAFMSVIFTFIIRDANVVGNSMLDTLHSDDKILMTNFMYKPKCGDIVAINAENQIEKRIIKRGSTHGSRCAQSRGDGNGGECYLSAFTAFFLLFFVIFFALFFIVFAHLHPPLNFFRATCFLFFR